MCMPYLINLVCLFYWLCSKLKVESGLAVEHGIPQSDKQHWDRPGHALDELEGPARRLSNRQGIVLQAD